jgi:hypothetical protein
MTRRLRGRWKRDELPAPDSRLTAQGLTIAFARNTAESNIFPQHPNFHTGRTPGMLI